MISKRTVFDVGVALLVLFSLAIVAIMLLVMYLLPIDPEDHEILISNVGDSSLEYKLFANDELIGEGVLAAHANATEVLTLKGNPDVILTLIAGGQSYERTYGGGGWGGPPAMPEKVYFIVEVP